MDLQQMRYVVAVADTGSFTRAAERCLVVQSALSHQIAKLERELGARLFDRTSRMVRVTPAGAAFLPSARQALDAAERARAEVAAATGEIRGRLAVGAIPTVAAVDLPHVLKEYHHRHPRVQVSLRTMASEVLVDQVREGTLDVAVLGLLPNMEPEGVRHRQLALDNLVAVVHPEHPLADEKQIELHQLADETFIDFPSGTVGRAQSDEAFRASGVSRHVPFEVSAGELMVRMVRSGLGVAMLPAAFTPQLDGIRTICVKDAPARIEVLVWSRFTPSPAAAAFLDTLGCAP